MYVWIDEETNNKDVTTAPSLSQNNPNVSMGSVILGVWEKYLRAGVKNFQIQLPAIDGQPFMVQGIWNSQKKTRRCAACLFPLICVLHILEIKT